MLEGMFWLWNIAINTEPWTVYGNSVFQERPQQCSVPWWRSRDFTTAGWDCRTWSLWGSRAGWQIEQFPYQRMHLAEVEDFINRTSEDTFPERRMTTEFLKYVSSIVPRIMVWIGSTDYTLLWTGMHKFVLSNDIARRDSVCAKEFPLKCRSWQLQSITHALLTASAEVYKL